jgi:hypothetical protein|tara:strand:- start:852 stop:1334 length:483 start_codon:yes stop_codon:yes gene_type:complete
MIRGYLAYLTGFDSQQQAEDRSHEMGIAFGLPCSGEHDTYMLFPVSECPWYNTWMLTVKKGYTQYLNDSEKQILLAYEPPHDNGMPFEVETPTFCKIPAANSGDTNFDEVLEINENLKYITSGTEILVSYFGDQPSFVFDITQNAIGLPEYTYKEVSGLL